MKRTNITYTSTLPHVLMESVTEYATRKNISKNKVIEAALQKFFEEGVKEELAETFKLASKDEEMLQWAEEGLADYLHQIKELEVNKAD